jgi:tetratricopeptide (TPR) repeat protein
VPGWAVWTRYNQHHHRKYGNLDDEAPSAMKSFRSLQSSLLGLCLAAGILVACAAPPTIPMEVEYAGCQAVLVPGPVCVLGESRELRLWVEAPLESRIEIQAGGSPLEAAGETVQDGQSFSLTLPAGAEKLDVLVETPQGQGAWSLSLATSEGEEHRGHDVIREVDEKKALMTADIRARRLGPVRVALDSLRVPPHAPAELRYAVAYYRGLLAEKEGDYRSALEAVQEAVEIAERMNWKNYQRVAEEKMALLLRVVGRSGESAQLFERLLRTPAANSCEEARLLNNQAWSALLAREAGERLADPAPLLARALEAYAACASATVESKANTLFNLALAHLQAGRLPQAKELLARVQTMEPHAPVPHRLWWLDLEARIALLEHRPAEGLQRFAALAKLAAETGSADAGLRAAFGKAQSYEALGDRTAALETLRTAESLLDEQSLQVPLQEGRETFVAARQAVVGLHIEILLDQGRNAQALDVARHARSRVLRQLASSDRIPSLPPERRSRWERLLTEYHARRAALEEKAKDDWKLPLDQVPREEAARRAEAEALKKLLDEAFLILSDPGERPGDLPPPPRPGELILAYHPLPHGWVGFAADGTTVAAHRFELPPDLSRTDELSRRLLVPFRAAIRQARRLRILSSGPLQAVDFHALPFDGDVLLASAPVVYGLDLPAARKPARPAGRHALLVADPRGNLLGALDEARAVGKALRSGPSPWTVEELKAGQASAATVGRRLAAADLLHYAGHGAFAGFGGWDSSLLLAEETRLTLGDLLALDRVPAWVVLSGCDTGRSSAETPVESLGLAQGFLLAGSQAVVASTRPVDDRSAPELFTALYRELEREPDLAVALQRAQLSWRQRHPRADWRSFRLFEP